MFSVGARPRCKADLEKGIKLGDITVSCEGYEYPDDPYILRDSCGLEYTLTGVAEVEKYQRYQTGHGHNGYQQQHAQHRYSGDSDYDRQSSPSGGTIFMWILVAGIAYVLYKTCTSGGSAGGVGRGGGGGGGAPGFPPGYPGGAPGGPSAPSWSSAADCAPTSSASSSSGPGFFTGAAGGAALGYMLGRRSGNQQQSVDTGGGRQVGHACSLGWCVSLERESARL